MLEMNTAWIDIAGIERHVEEKLRRAETREGGLSDRLGALRRFIEVETRRLQLRHRYGIGGVEIAGARTLIVDRLIQHLASTALLEQTGATGSSPALAVVALGGYGRRELAPYSDIDILFLCAGRSDAGTKLSESLLYLLWDVGFTVGHSMRSIDDCVAMAREDRVSRHSLIDARFLWGDRGLFEQMEERLSREIFEKNRQQHLAELMADREERYSRFGGVVCLQEPNIKESAGGLRDAQTLAWAGRIAEGVRGIGGLAASGLIPAADGAAIVAANGLLMRVRNELHFLTGRHSDVLTLALQQQAAANFRYDDSAHQQASELFMRDYYLQARRLHLLATAHLQRLMLRHEKRRWFQRSRTAPAIGGFVMRDGALDLDDRGVAQGMAHGMAMDAGRMLLAFGYAQATGSTMSAALQTEMQEGMKRLPHRFAEDPAVIESFLRLMSVRGKVARGLRMMHELDFLGALVPEFGRLTCLVQHDLYHRFTVDEHTIRAIETLDELANSRTRSMERYREIQSRLRDPLVLHLGLFFHDIGKGLGGGHTEKGINIARGVLTRWGIDPQRSETVIFLIRYHQLMSHISQRRDLSDEKVIRDFAALVGNVERLELLTLLTYADISAVGPGIWSEWKDTLLWELYMRTRAELGPGEERERERDELIRKMTRMLASEMDEAAVRDHFQMLPEDYGRFTPPATIAEHLRLVQQLNSRVVKTSWKTDTSAKCTNLHLSARNRRGLLAGVAGALTAQGVNILSVHLNTRADGLAVDSFKVRDAAGEPISDPVRWEQIDYEITRALNGEFDVAAAVARRLQSHNSSRLRKRKVPITASIDFCWDQESSEKSTILEVRTGDRLGLAYRIASTLAELRLDIVFAKVATEKHLALDIFYVVDESGEKLPNESLPRIEEALRESLRDRNEA